MLRSPLARAQCSHLQPTIMVIIGMPGYSSVSEFGAQVTIMVVIVERTVWIQTAAVDTTPVGPMGKRGAELGGPILLETASHVCRKLKKCMARYVVTLLLQFHSCVIKQVQVRETYNCLATAWDKLYIVEDQSFT